MSSDMHATLKNHARRHPSEQKMSDTPRERRERKHSYLVGGSNGPLSLKKESTGINLSYAN